MTDTPALDVDAFEEMAEKVRQARPETGLD